MSGGFTRRDVRARCMVAVGISGGTAMRRTITGALAALALGACAQVEEVREGFGDAVAAALNPRAPGQTADAMGGVGIVGTVLDMQGPVLSINGLAVETQPQTVLNGPFGPLGSLEGGLIPTGHVVEVAAEREAGRLVAREIEPIHALAGPLQAVDREGRRLMLLGTEVLLEPDAVLPRGGIGAFRPGQRVAVSGLWRDERVIASRVDFQSPKAVPLAKVSGVVTPRPGGRFAIGPVLLAAEMGDLRPGFFHVVDGEWDAGILLVEDIRFGRTVVGRWPVDVLSVEAFGRGRDFAGYYSGYPGPDRGGYFEGYSFTGREGKWGPEPHWRDYFADLDGLGRPVDDDDEIGVFSETRAVFVGEYDGGYDGEFDIDFAIPVPEGAIARADTLAAVGDGLAPATGAVFLKD